MHFLDEMPRYGVSFDMINPLEYESFERANEEIVKKIKKGKYDLFMSTPCFPEYIFPETLSFVSKMGLPSLCFRPDNLSVPMRDKEVAPLFDLVWLTAPETQYLYDKWGAKTIVLPYAANPFVYTMQGMPQKNGICFIGTPHGARPKILNELANNKITVDVYCKGQSNKVQNTNDINLQAENKWKTVLHRLAFAEGRKVLMANLFRKCTTSTELSKSPYINILPKLSFEDMIAAYTEYSLSLSFTSYGNTDLLKKPLNVINLRNFEVPMCGGLQICRYSDEMASYFENGKEIVMYESTEEMVDKVKYYLNVVSQSEIAEMKRCARKRAESEHSWKCRFDKLFNELGI